MITVVIKDNGEPSVVQMTYENLYRELKDIDGARLIVASNWWDPLNKVKNDYICFVEADCLVSSGFFSSQLGLFKKNPYFRKLGMLASATGVNNWANRVYGYHIKPELKLARVVPNLDKKSNSVYSVQIGFVPGAVLRTSMLKRALQEIRATEKMTEDLVQFSTILSFALWGHGDRIKGGSHIHLNPNTTYVTTENYVNDIGKFDPHIPTGLMEKFKREGV